MYSAGHEGINSHSIQQAPDTATLRFLFKMKSYQIMNGRDFNGSKSFLIAFHQHQLQQQRLPSTHYYHRRSHMADGPMLLGRVE